MKHTSLLLAALLSGCAPEGADLHGADRATGGETASVADDAAGTCPDGAPVAVGRDAIGGVSFDLTLEEVRTLCPAARDTSWGIYERVFPGLYLPMDGLTVFALQDRTVVDEESGFDVPDEPDPNAPPDLWVVSGAGGTLPGGVAIDVPWRELREAYGEARVSDEIFVTAAFCKLPGWRFQFPFKAFRAGAIEPEARAEMITISLDEWRLRLDAAACD